VRRVVHKRHLYLRIILVSSLSFSLCPAACAFACCLRRSQNGERDICEQACATLVLGEIRANNISPFRALGDADATSRERERGVKVGGGGRRGQCVGGRRGFLCVRSCGESDVGGRRRRPLRARVRTRSVDSSLR